ncbi:hypothetical protein DSLASN_25640 [Desulfoluna limicola]|uniref:Uncharacterized protein n=1 Tax=Desulfoluna limicola TaxID=2810562 RepID=A0ABM7PI87_9BACT|nr:hypothetical protein DSLASN_25640 [Desulfoluna limicola]
MTGNESQGAENRTLACAGSSGASLCDSDSRVFFYGDGVGSHSYIQNFKFKNGMIRDAFLI